MAFIPLISGDWEIKLMIGFLLGTGFLIFLMFILVGIAFLQGNDYGFGAMRDGAGASHPGRLLPRLHGIFKERCVRKGTLLFLAVGAISVLIILVLLALAVSSVCLSSAKEVTYMIAGIAAVVFLGGSLVCRLGVRRRLR
jgi:hypothetical protein